MSLPSPLSSSLLGLLLISLVGLNCVTCARWKQLRQVHSGWRRVESLKDAAFQNYMPYGENGITATARVEALTHRQLSLKGHSKDGVRRAKREAAKGNSILSVSSRTKSNVVRQYGTTFLPTFVNPNEEPLIDLMDSDPDQFFSDFVSYVEDPRSKNRITWYHPFARTYAQKAALHTLSGFMPKSRIRECLNVTDGSNVDDLVDRTCHGYYCNRHMNAFFNYEEEFNYMRNGTDIIPRRLEPPELKLPMGMPPTEGDKERASVPLGWRTFAVLGLYSTASGVSDPSILWSGYPLEDGEPMGRLASGLYAGSLGLTQFTAKDAAKPDNTLLRSKFPIEQDEEFRGQKGDLSHLGPRKLRQHETINESLCEFRFSNDKVWPKRHFECVVSSMTILQALWARLSTTMLRSTAKMHRLYKLRIRKNFKQEVFSVTRKHNFTTNPEETKEEPVETSVGNIYFMSAPTLHHAVEFACSDPLARNNFYKQLVMFEADDVLKNHIFEPRHPNYDNPRQYLVLGSYDGSDTPDLLRDKMDRFLMRSNCVNTHITLHPPRKDSLVDFRLPLQQFLPITSDQREKVINSIGTLKDACLTGNEAPAIGDLTIINQFDSDDAYDWARRSPYTRSGCYESLFVAKAREIVFYGRHCKYVAPLPMEKALTPVRQEYAVIERDPVDVLRKRLSDGLSHMVVLPKVVPSASTLYEHLVSDQERHNADGYPNKERMEENEVNTKCSVTDRQETIENKRWWPKRLFISLRRTVSDNFKACKVSSVYTSQKKRKHERQAYLGQLPFRKGETLSVDSSAVKDTLGRKGISMHYVSDRNALNSLDSRAGRNLLYVDTDIGTPIVHGDVQIIPNVLLSSKAIQRLLSENAPIELDRPFYADLLKDYVYISLPAGDFFECLPGADDRRANAMLPGSEHQSVASASDMNRLPQNKPIAAAGYWIKKRDCYLLYKSEDDRCLLLGREPQRKDRRGRLKADMLKRAMVKNEICLDYHRKGADLAWPDTSNAYTRRGGKLITHLSPEEQLKTVWTVDPLNSPYARFNSDDELPSARFYESNEDYSPDDPRYLMAQNPEEVYKISLEFLRKVERGEARVEDDPIKAITEADHVLPAKHKDTISTWEDPDTDILKINEKVSVQERIY